MLSYFKYFLLSVIVSVNIFAGVDYNDPVNTPFGTPNLSDPGAEEVQIVSDDTGQYVYAVWKKFGAPESSIQFSRSTNNGDLWEEPQELSVKVNDVYCSNPKIATDSTGQYVYVAWETETFGSFALQTVVSNTSGQTWPSSIINLAVGLGESPAQGIVTDDSGRYVYVEWLDTSGDNEIRLATSIDYGSTFPSIKTITDPGIVFDPKITIDRLGQYIYMSWVKLDHPPDWSYLHFYIEEKHSSDFGVSWSDTYQFPSDNNESFDEFIVTDDRGEKTYLVYKDKNEEGDYVAKISSLFGSNGSWSNPIKLSDETKSIKFPKIAISSSGKYVHVIWETDAGGGEKIYARSSDDYGKTWNPIKELSDPTNNAIEPQITSSANGKLVYAVWQESDGANYRITTSNSLNYGTDWIDPVSTPSGTPPYLSVAGVEGLVPQITIDLSGKYSYAVWSGNVTIQEANGVVEVEDFNISYDKNITKLLLQRDVVNGLFWNDIALAIKYRVYLDLPNNCLAEVDLLSYFQHGVEGPSTYYVTWIDYFGVESSPEEISVP